MPKGNPQWTKGHVADSPRTGRPRLFTEGMENYCLRLPRGLYKRAQKLGLNPAAIMRDALVATVERAMWRNECRGVKDEKGV